MSKGRVLGIDLGEVRIGLALSDPGRVIASPHSVLRRSASHSHDHREIVAVARGSDASLIVVGLPRSLSGIPGAAERVVREEVSELRVVASDAGIDVDVYDERLTTVVAQQALRAAGVKARDQKDVVDKVAAAVMLEGWLAAHS